MRWQVQQPLRAKLAATHFDIACAGGSASWPQQPAPSDSLLHQHDLGAAQQMQWQFEACAPEVSIVLWYPDDQQVCLLTLCSSTLSNPAVSNTLKSLRHTRQLLAEQEGNAAGAASTWPQLLIPVLHVLHHDMPGWPARLALHCFLL